MNDPIPHPSALPAEALLAECSVRFTRRSGPGGQNRNKVETAVILEHQSTGITAEANEERSQSQNRAMALFRLRLKLAVHVRHERESSTQPSRLWRSRLRGGRIAVNPMHDDFPALLAEMLDAVHAANDEPSAAAERLGCSATQIIKLLKAEPRAFAALNERRKSSGRHPFV
jgi:RF-1 domain